MWVEKTKQGKYKFVERYTCPLTGKQKRASVTYSKNTASTRKLAAAELAEKIKEKERLITSDNITLGELAEYYLEAKAKEVKRSTLDTTNLTVANLLRKVDNNLLASKINAINIKPILEELTKSDVKRLKMVLSWSYKQGYLIEPVHLKIPNKKAPKEAGSKKLYLEKEELKEVIKELDKTADTYSQLISRYLAEFLALTGIRFGEAVALLETDIEDHRLAINKTIYKGEAGPPKSEASNRIIVLNKRAIKIIKEVTFLKRINRIESPIVFSSCQGRYYSNKLFNYNLKKINEELYPHIFRHTHASLLAEQGVALEAIQRRLGHSSGEITKEIYIHITEKQKAQEEKLFKELDIL